LLYSKLQHQTGIADHTLDTLRDLYRGTDCVVTGEGCCSLPYGIACGLWKDCPLSTTLLNMFISLGPAPAPLGRRLALVWGCQLAPSPRTLLGGCQRDALCAIIQIFEENSTNHDADYLYAMFVAAQKLRSKAADGRVNILVMDAFMQLFHHNKYKTRAGAYPLLDKFLRLEHAGQLAAFLAQCNLEAAV
jgi:hypothetical protein